ncbi:SDR family oxidoreductase [Oceanicoccus sp. KOV_DT_Chl]|uniref:SDR family oxidoreductase n=1 Tax=Oceanicoccus sp. KOV_DT_Chl TaxID=1904639 RepID=UPI000C7DBBE2|nr:SDR family oxidoreductase [Oceanicoccus sp. KOV_DT_Chl]
MAGNKFFFNFWAGFVAALLLSSFASAVEAAGKSTVLVAGATGGTGRLVVTELLAADYHVVAMARNGDKAKQLFSDYLDKGVTIAVADVTEPETLPAIFAQVDYVISTLGTAIGSEGDNNPETVDYQGTVELIEQAKYHSIKKFILITSGGTTWWLHPLNWFGDDVLKWKHKSELYLRDSGINHVIIRPAGGLKDEPANTKAIKFTQTDGIPSTISRADVATVAVKALIHDQATNKTFEIQDDDDGQTTASINWQQVFADMTVDSDNF